MKLSELRFNVRLLSAERLSGLERESYSYFSNSSLTSGWIFQSLINIKSMVKNTVCHHLHLLL